MSGRRVRKSRRVLTTLCLDFQHGGDHTLRQEITKYLKERGVYGDPLSRDYASMYRIVLDVDGNAWSSRLPTLLASGALVLRAAVQSSFLDGYLQPYKHYIPVRMDYSDLVSYLGMTWNT